MILEKDKVFTNTYETAAWYENVLVKAGKYPMYKNLGNTGVSGGIYTSLEGTVVDDYFGSLFFGNPIGTYDTKKNAGNRSCYTAFMRDYSLADRILGDDRFNDDGTIRYELTNGYKAERETFISSIDGKEYTIGKLIKEGD